MLVILENHLAVAERCPVTVCPLNESAGSSREIVAEFRHSLAHAFKVDDVDVCLLPDFEQSAIGAAHDSGRGRSHSTHGLLDWEKPFLPYPMGQHEGAPARIHDLPDMSAGIAEPREHVTE
jgi:hypothetical protein